VARNGSLPQQPQRVALYCRVSSEDQRDAGTIRAQLDFLRGYATLYELDVAGEYLDDGFSGTLPLASRPDGRRLLDAADAHRFDAVLVYKLDRLGRTLAALLDAHATL
jgi:site-specific DNA recombinase